MPQGSVTGLGQNQAIVFYNAFEQPAEILFLVARQAKNCKHVIGQNDPATLEHGDQVRMPQHGDGNGLRPHG